MEEFTVIFYDKANGAEPAKDFPNALDKKVMAKMARMISMLQENGPELREPYSKPVGDIRTPRKNWFRYIPRSVFFLCGAHHCADEWIHQENAKDTSGRD